MSPTIPHHLLPTDGRFGSGPARIRPESLTMLAASPVMGTSHRQAPVKNVVKQLQQDLLGLYRAPEGHRVVLGNGGASFFWDIAACSLVERRSAHGVFGEFSSKFAKATARAPFLDAPAVTEVPAGRVALPEATDADVYGWAQNETSTGASAPVLRPEGIADDALVLVDATSAAGGIDADLTGIDTYYFAPQKNFSSDGGLWFAIASPAAIERAERLTRDAGRWVPDALNFTLAAENSAKNQTLNTPALATLLLMADQVRWMLDNGGMDFVAGRTRESSSVLYEWADAHELATPFVEPEFRSPVVATIDFAQSVDAAALAADLRANGIVDVEPYRKLGRNQLRVGCYASVEPDDVRALVACIDWLLEQKAD